VACVLAIFAFMPLANATQPAKKTANKATTDEMSARAPRPVSGPIKVKTPTPTPATPAIPPEVADAMQAIISQTGAVFVTQPATPGLATAATATRSTFQRKSLPTKTRAQAFAVAEDEYTPSTDQAGFHLVLTEKKYADFYQFQSLETWLRKDYAAGGTFYTLEIFTPKFGGVSTANVQGPVALNQDNRLGSRVPVYYRRNYSGWGTFSLYVFFVGGDGSFRMDRVTYYCGSAPATGQLGYHADTARAHADTQMIDVTGFFPKGVPIYLMMGNTGGACWGQDPLFSFDGKHLYHKDYQTGAYEQGVPGWFVDGDTEGFVLLFIAQPGNEQHLKVEFFLPGVPSTIGGSQG
jgi:hypothetical protein